MRDYLTNSAFFCARLFDKIYNFSPSSLDEISNFFCFPLSKFAMILPRPNNENRHLFSRYLIKLKIFFHIPLRRFAIFFPTNYQNSRFSFCDFLSRLANWQNDRLTKIFIFFVTTCNLWDMFFRNWLMEVGVCFRHLLTKFAILFHNWLIKYCCWIIWLNSCFCNFSPNSLFFNASFWQNLWFAFCNR